MQENPQDTPPDTTPLKSSAATSGSSLKLLFNLAYPNIGYDLQMGVFWRIDTSTGAPTRELTLDDSSRIVCKLRATGKNTNRKASILAWEIIHGKDLPDGYVVYFKDLNESNLRGYNLGAVTKAEYAQIKDAVDNLSGYAKLIPHATEVYSYKVRFKQGGFTVHQSFHDITAAKHFHRLLVINSTVLLNKYLVSA